MFSVYLCESTSEQLNYHKEILSKYALINNFPLEKIYQTKSPHLLLQELKQFPPMMGLYYLDVRFDGDMDSFQLAENIRAMDPLGHLVFIDIHSATPRYPFEKHLEAMGYMIQTDAADLPGRLIKCLSTAIHNYYNFSNYPYYPNKLILKLNGEIKLIPYEDLIFLETEFQNHKISIHTKKERLSLRGSIKEFSQKLDSNIFCQISQSAIVNILWVGSVDSKKRLIHMKSGQSLEYSYRYQGYIFSTMNQLKK